MQALDILDQAPALAKTIADQGIPNACVFTEWLEEERVYLRGLSKEPIRETQEMEYYQKLVNLKASEYVLLTSLTSLFNKVSERLKLEAARQLWHNLTPATQGGRDYTQSRETERRHALETRDKDLLVVQDLERKLEVVERWTSERPEWGAAAVLVGKRRYQRCLDSLEGLIVSRMFELTKMNLSQTGTSSSYLFNTFLCTLVGYKLRKHIAKALQARSQAIRNALEKYNNAASALSPPRPHLSWNDVVEYAFLADFDLLRDTRRDIRDRPWATPACRLAMDRYFKLERAREEIQRLNIEILRVITYLCDEDVFLKKKEDEIRLYDSSLAHQVSLHRRERGRFNSQHMNHFKKLAALPGFTGSILPGISLESAVEGLTEHGTNRDEDMQVDANERLPERVRIPDEGTGDEEWIDDGVEEEELAAQLYNVL
jgi:hypothetical protein